MAKPIINTEVAGLDGKKNKKLKTGGQTRSYQALGKQLDIQAKRDRAAKFDTPKKRKPRHDNALSM